METGSTNFNSPNHGFKFANRFELPDIFNTRLSFLRLKDIIYGLCGGMSFGAIDYFKHGRPVPNFDDPEEISVKLFRFLWDRQLDSLRDGTLRKLVTGIFRSDSSLGNAVTYEAIPKVRQAIDAGTPAVLALVRTKGFNDPTRNHQVLATDYEFDPQTKNYSLTLYDPNHPNRKPTLEISLSDSPGGFSIRQSTGEKLRGFFVIDYTEQTPPV